MKQTPVVFDCRGDRLVGVVTTPLTAADLGVVIIVGGPQYRVGSHRQFVHLSRRLAAEGVASIRFDLRGMGDSEGEPRSFEALDEDIEAAIGTLQANAPTVRHVVLWGLCGGASAALLYGQRCEDARLRGVALVNPWARTETTQAVTRVKHYYLERLRSREFWRNLLRGRIGPANLREFAISLGIAARASMHGPTGSSRPPTLGQRLAGAWLELPGDILLILSGRDYTAKEFIETCLADQVWRANLKLSKVTRLDVPDADHTFSQPDGQSVLEDATVSWMKRLQQRLSTAAN